MAAGAAAQGAGVLALNARIQVAITAKLVEHLLHSRRQVGSEFMTGVTGSASAVINKIMVALSTTNLRMIPMFKVNRQHWMCGYCHGAVMMELITRDC